MVNGRVKLGRGQTSQCEAKYCLPFTASPDVCSPTSQREHAPIKNHSHQESLPSRITPIKDRITSKSLSAPYPTFQAERSLTAQVTLLVSVTKILPGRGPGIGFANEGSFRQTAYF
ncbi:hypothetical protein N7478_010253 [Penicillium angulare]|uniref:uncharacterized protein n=1 Tax=Penicillium angulare TaxID=116970 RepID=UPI002540A9C8|nr:uncharacterized protein N7478_010253 [Penicillium angulare]KAJ5267445.1 hypothetical protein N7478_010253 [Penicillium angulare]